MKSGWLMILLVAATLLRMAWVAWVGPGGEDAYQWLCAQRWAPAFFDGPSGTASCLVLFLGLGDRGLFVAAVMWPLWGLAASWAAWLLARSVSDQPAVCAWSVLLLNVLPIFNRSAITVGPELPALALATVGLWALRRVWLGKSGGWIVAAGAFAGAVNFRYETALVPLVVGGLLLCSPRRRTARNFGGWLLTLLAVTVATLPALLWNARNEWVPMVGGTWRTLWEFRQDGFGGRVTGFALAMSPLLAAGWLAALGWMLLRCRRSVRTRFLLAAALPGALGVLICLWRGGDLTVAMLVSAVPVLILIAQEAGERRPLRWLLLGAVLAALGGTAQMAWAERAERTELATIAEGIRTALKEVPATEYPPFLIAESPELAAALSGHFRDLGTATHPPVFVPESPAIESQFGLWPSYADFVETTAATDEFFTEQKGANPYVGRNAIYIGADLPQTIGAAFAEVRPIARIPRAGFPELVIFLCLNYETLPL